MGEEDSEGLLDQLRHMILSNVSRLSQSLIISDREHVQYAKEEVTQGVGDAAGQSAQVTVTDETSLGIPSRRVEATLFVVQDPEKLLRDVTAALVTAQEASSRARNVGEAQ